MQRVGDSEFYAICGREAVNDTTAVNLAGVEFFADANIQETAWIGAADTGRWLPSILVRRHERLVLAVR